MTRYEELQTFLENIRAEKAVELPMFNNILQRSETLLTLSDFDLAKEIMISRSTVTRWRNGKTAPHLVMRRPVLDLLEEKAKSAIKAYSRGNGGTGFGEAAAASGRY